MAHSTPIRPSFGTHPATRLIILAGRSPGRRDPLAERFNASHRCLVPLEGRPLLAHVLQTAKEHPAIESLAVCIEREAFDPAWDMLTHLPGRGSVALVEARPRLSDSVRAAAEGWDGPILVTTADHVLLDAAAIDTVLGELARAHAIFALTRQASVRKLHQGRRAHVLRLRDGEYVPCDLYGMRSPAALDLVDIFRGKGANGRLFSRVLRAAGLAGLAMLLLRLETLSGAMRRISRRMKLEVRTVVLEDARQALDIDDEVSLAVVRDLLHAAARPVRETVEAPAALAARS